MGYIDLRSDTVTHPTPEMREAMYRAEVGDDVYRDDPSVNAMEEESARILGTESALFVSSGTMGNQLGIMVHTHRGDEIIAGAESHIFTSEVGGAAVLSGANIRQMIYPNSIPVPELIEGAIRTDDIHDPPTALICLENALANGRVVPLDVMKKVARVAKKHKLPVHLDGARIFNAAVSLGCEAKDIMKHVDSVSCCLSKGLCAPVGCVFAASREKVERARKYRKMLGGGTRQAGILAAAALIAIRDMPKRLWEDHENAAYMARRLAELPGIEVDLSSVQVNIVFFNIARPRAMLDAIPAKMKELGVLVNPEENGMMRFVTHYGVAKQDVDRAIDAFAQVIGK
ncbi:MAG TPA: GntG family PLP-dependent aldolase [Clostridia bacterium]|nr:GntG family PLP-dependent aldolase [Clostridia bacterium]